MKNTVEPFEYEDFLFLLGGDNPKRFSSIYRFVPIDTYDPVSVLCSEIRAGLSEHKVKTSGNAVLRIISPASPELTVGEVYRIREAVHESGIGSSVWSYMSDDEADGIIVDVLFEVEP